MVQSSVAWSQQQELSIGFQRFGLLRLLNAEEQKLEIILEGGQGLASFLGQAHIYLQASQPQTYAGRLEALVQPTDPSFVFPVAWEHGWVSFHNGLQATYRARRSPSSRCLIHEKCCGKMIRNVAKDTFKPTSARDSLRQVAIVHKA
jgi:hypothetical protein